MARSRCSVFACALLLCACSAGGPSGGHSGETAKSTSTADVLFHGGDILTLAGQEPSYADALVVRGGRILFVGEETQALALASEQTELIDLDGRTLLPGFFDAHSHFLHTAIKLSTVNLDPPPAGVVTSIPELQAQLAAELREHPRLEGEWLFGWGYDNGMLRENRHPLKADLDAVSRDIPIAIYHFSSHMVVLNSAGLEQIGIGAESVAPPGGVIRRLDGGKEPNGILEEQAILPVMQLLLGSAQGEKLTRLLDASQQLYLSQGFTTMTEMASAPANLDPLRRYADAGRLRADLVTTVLAVTQGAEATSKLYSRKYENRLRVGGGKINLDGGSPGRTAYLREPYVTQDEGVSASYRGYPSIADQDELNAMISSFYELETPIFIHALGDAAIDQAAAAIAAAESLFPREDIRTQLIHLQVFHDDQMDTLAGLDVTLSFQNTHNFYFADFHDKFTLGPKRTARLCPMNSAHKRGFSVTFHHDSPVHPVSQLGLIWIATNRRSRSHRVYGPDERITAYQALRASTIGAAYQWFEEDQKGTLEVGKLADLVVLSANPLKVPVSDLAEIEVLQTFKEGKSVWMASAP